jgi:hypothetical protein
MKYLKYFEGTDNSKSDIPQEDLDRMLDEIKSAFIEYLDEYDIELIPDDFLSHHFHLTGLYYDLWWNWYDTRNKKIGFEFSIYIYWNDNFSKSLVVNRFYNFYDKLEDVKSHLESMGYQMRYDGIDEEEFSEDPDEFCIKISYWL